MKITGLTEKLDLPEGGATTRDLPVSAHVALALARTTLPGQVYAGTVPEHVTASRRKKNKQARASRRINRGRK